MSAYRCVQHANADDFLARAEPFLMQNEAEHNLILGIAAQLRSSPAVKAFLATLEHDGDIVGCAFRTPPYKLSVTRMPHGAAEALTDSDAVELTDVPAVLGPAAVAGVVAERIARKQGITVAPGMQQRIYELREVSWPLRPPRGRLRLAQHADFEVLTHWLEAFAAETQHGPGDVRTYALSHIANKTVFVWDDGGPKTTALWSGLTPNGVRIGFVYTPPELRGRGYASACVAGASQRALDSGYRFCCLYTDLGNPTSNDIYQKVGYRRVCDVVDYNLGA
jgi:predicted GNAT family acetyltransferase